MELWEAGFFIEGSPLAEAGRFKTGIAKEHKF